MDKTTREGEKGSLSISVHLLLSSGTVLPVSTIDICGRGCHLQREGGAHNDTW
jgi:hypothetical protein